MARMRVARAPPKMAAHVRRAVQAQRNEAVPTRPAAPAQPRPRMRRLRVAAQRNPPSGPHRPPARHPPRLRVPPRGLPQNERSRPPRRRSVPPDRLPRSASGTVIVLPPSAPDSSRPRPKPRQEHRLRRLSLQRLLPQPSSGLPQAPLVRPTQSAPRVRVTPNGRTASAPATSAPARTHPPRPQPRRLPHLRRQQPLRRHPLLRRLHLPLQQRARPRLRQLQPPLPLQREPSPRHPHRARPRLSRPRLPRPSRWMPPASASRTCAANVASAVKAAV